MVKYRSSPKTAKGPSIAKKLVIFLIIIIVAIVGTAVACSFLLTPERLVTSKMENLVANYYENDFYPSVLSSENFSGDIAATFEKYELRGFPTLTLRQLLASDQAGLAPADADYLRQYCDENTTTVKIHPTAPYGQSDYSVDYSYSCEY